MRVDERLRLLECWLNLEHEKRLTLEKRVRELEEKIGGKEFHPVIVHELMQYAYVGKEERLTTLLTELDRYRMKDDAQGEGYYLFDLEHYSKTRIYRVWKEIEGCLDMKQRTLAVYIMENTNLGKNMGTVRRYL
ncbi:MAG: hypothetical protein K2G76_09660 [Prevotella sp.]|nr:hypothetical protein [Prevotella sp.]